jgi:hypothetical protein
VATVGEVAAGAALGDDGDRLASVPFPTTVEARLGAGVAGATVVVCPVTVGDTGAAPQPAAMSAAAMSMTGRGVRLVMAGIRSRRLPG